MRATKTWVGIIFIIAALIAAYVLNWILIDALRWFHVANSPVFGSQFRLSAAIAGGIAVLLAFYLGVLNNKSKSYVEEVVVEFNKVAWPSPQEARFSTAAVVIISCIVACILSVFDAAFSWLIALKLFIR